MLALFTSSVLVTGETPTGLEMMRSLNKKPAETDPLSAGIMLTIVSRIFRLTALDSFACVAELNQLLSFVMLGSHLQA